MPAHFRLLSISLLLFGLFSAVCAAQTLDYEAESALTVDMLQMKLYAKTDAEKKYCAAVIQRRDQGVLPNRILYSAYRYAVKKDKDRRFIYFQKTLEHLCKEAKIELKIADTQTSQKKYFFATKASTATPKSYSSAPKTATNPFSAIFRLYK